MKMSPQNEQILVDYLDNSLEGEARLQAEQLISEDAAAAQELEHLRFSVDLIRETSVLDQVKEVRKSFLSGAKVVPFEKKESGAVVRSFSKTFLRIAAVLLLVAGSASVYKYMATTTGTVYDKNFTSFELETSRGSNTDGEMEKAYRSKNWTIVTNIFNAQKEKTSKSWFLAGMADMELRNYPAAILSFNTVMNVNRNTAAPQYQDESEYYLALSYLAAQQPTEGVAILKKIRADKDHLYNKKALNISTLDLKLLELKK